MRDTEDDGLLADYAESSFDLYEHLTDEARTQWPEIVGELIAGRTRFMIVRWEQDGTIGLELPTSKPNLYVVR